LGPREPRLAAARRPVEEQAPYGPEAEGVERRGVEVQGVRGGGSARVGFGGGAEDAAVEDAAQDGGDLGAEDPDRARETEFEVGVSRRPREGDGGGGREVLSRGGIRGV